MQSINPSWLDKIGHTPKFVKIKKSSIHGRGAFSKVAIKKGTFLGHYMGKISKAMNTGPYIFHSKRNGDIISIDANNINYSNWARYMNCSTNITNENVASFFLTNKEIYKIKQQYKNYEGYIVFYANRNIKKGEELLYYYGDAYAKLLDINYQRTMVDSN